MSSAWLPAPTGGSSTSPNSATAARHDELTPTRHHHAWQRAMEQAQLLSWFKPPASVNLAVSEADSFKQPVQAGRPTAQPLQRAAPKPLQAPYPVARPPSPASKQPEYAESLPDLQLSRPRRAAIARDTFPPGPPPAASALPHHNGIGQHRQHDAAEISEEVMRYLNQRGGLAPPDTQPLSVPPVASLPPHEAKQLAAQPDSSLSTGYASLAWPLSAITSPPTPATLAEPLPADAVLLLVEPDRPVAAATEAVGINRMTLVQSRPPGEGTAAPVRLHVDWAADGARIWLGVNQAELPLVPALVRHLEAWLQASGAKLARLVCNGLTVYHHPLSTRRPS